HLLDDFIPLGTTKFACFLVTLAPRSRCIGHGADDAASPPRCAGDHMTLLSVGGVCLLAVHTSREPDRYTSGQRCPQGFHSDILHELVSLRIVVDAPRMPHRLPSP